MNKSNLTKNLIFSLVCILLTSILIMGFIFPQIKSYKKLKIIEQNQERINKEHQTQYDYLAGKLQNFIQDNNTMITMYQTKFDEKNFNNFCLKFFNSAKLDYEKSSQTEKYQKYILKVSTNIDSPTNFYDFIKELKNYQSIVKVEFPITLKANGNEIEAVFNIKVFKD